MNTRMEFLQFLVDQFGYKSYLEIGCDQDETFSFLKVPKKVGVDPAQGGTHRMTSDEFFAQNREPFDLVFVDGLHTQDQAFKDVLNSLGVLTANGMIVMHDCCPSYEAQQKVPREVNDWTGDVWRAFLRFRSLPTVDCAVVNIETGCGVVLPRPNQDQLFGTLPKTWADFEPMKAFYLRLMSFEVFKKWVGVF